MSHDVEAPKPYMFRPYVPDDVPFIDSSWARSYFKCNNYKELLGPTEFNRFHRPIRERFFGRPNATVIICASKEDSNHILAWAAVEQLDAGLIIHYIYVKQAFKREGLGKELVDLVAPKGKAFYTHLTPLAQEIKAYSKKYNKFKYIPHLV